MKPITPSLPKTNEHPVIAGHHELTLGQRGADKLTARMGSWGFISGFGSFLVGWIGLNVAAYEYSWDPYPFILLNLVLSCLSAVQAPVILMSQNREADRNRITARYDYAVNRKAEREIQQIQRELAEIKKMLLTRSQ